MDNISISYIFIKQQMLLGFPSFFFLALCACWITQSNKTTYITSLFNTHTYAHSFLVSLSLSLYIYIYMCVCVCVCVCVCLYIYTCVCSFHDSFKIEFLSFNKASQRRSEYKPQISIHTHTERHGVEKMLSWCYTSTTRVYDLHGLPWLVMA